MPAQIAYFSMEIGLDVKLPTYSGGLGVLAGDTLKSAADLGLPVVGVTLLYRKGYFRQEIDADGRQKESEVVWDPAKLLKPTNKFAEVEIEGRKVRFTAWQYDVIGARGHVVPVYFLDAKDASNDAYDQTLSDQLYGGDGRYRICQELLLGRGGIRILDQLGLLKDKSGQGEGLECFHMNEGHSAFLTLELLARRTGIGKLGSAKAEDLAAIKSLCVFTTHTPVAAGHDRFSAQITEKALGSSDYQALKSFEVLGQDQGLNMTTLALKFSRFVNGVAKRHGEVSQKMFPTRKIEAITNGVHAGSWLSPKMAELFDRYLPRWREDNAYLRSACEIPLADLEAAHRLAKKDLIDRVESSFGIKWNVDTFTIGFARRAATYKRADLLFWDTDKLKSIADRWGGLQICYAGKAHPKDEGGKDLIKRVIERSKELGAKNISVVYLPNYNMELGRLICSGVDLWLNNPVKPMEASGTSGMKAALNGIPSLSTFDGWWVEGLFEGVTGWEIEDEEDAMVSKAEGGTKSAQAANALYRKLGDVILPMYLENKVGYQTVMRNSIAINGTFFNTQRMVEQYARLAYPKASWTP